MIFGEAFCIVSCSSRLAGCLWGAVAVHNLVEGAMNTPIHSASNAGSLQTYVLVSLTTLILGCDWIKDGQHEVASRVDHEIVPADKQRSGSHDGVVTRRLSEHDFGIVEVGSVHRHSFVLSNETRERWVVSGIKTSCGCTDADIDQQVIMPGGAAKVNLSYRATPSGVPARISAFEFSEALPVGFPLVAVH